MYYLISSSLDYQPKKYFRNHTENRDIYDMISALTHDIYLVNEVYVGVMHDIPTCILSNHMFHMYMGLLIQLNIPLASKQ